MHKHSFQVDDHNGRQHSLKHRTSTLASPLVSRDPLDTLCPQEPCWLLTVLLLPSPQCLWLTSKHSPCSSQGIFLKHTFELAIASLLHMLGLPKFFQHSLLPSGRRPQSLRQPHALQSAARSLGPQSLGHRRCLLNKGAT